MEPEIKSCSRNVRKLEPEKNNINPNALTQETVPKLMDLYPVEPFTSGYGPPYAPDDWPCPGDKWKWSVGRRISATGIFSQRYLYPPPHFQRPVDGKGTRNYISVRSHVEKYIRKVFPDKDLVAFLASFSWNIPSKNFIGSKAQTASCLSNKSRQMKEHENDCDEGEPAAGNDEEESAADDDQEWVEEPSNTRKRKREPAPTSMYRRKTRHSFKFRFPSNIKKQPIFIDLTQESESGPSSSSLKDNSEKNSKSENNQVSSHQNSVSAIGTSHSHANLQESMDAHLEPFKTNSEDPGFSIVLSVENKIDEAQRKLASLLAVEFSHSITTENIAELTNVLSVIKKDSRLSLDQLLKLHMIEEIPLLGRCFLEASQEMEYDECCVSLVPNISKIISLIHCYNQFKDKATQMQAEIDASLVAKQDLEKEIANLQTQRAKLVGDVDYKITVKNEILSTQRNLADFIPDVLEMIEVGSSKSHKLEARKAEAAKRMAEIIAKYAS